MSTLFKWNMLVTSFIPLWGSVIFMLLWDIFSCRYSSFICLVKTNQFELALITLIMIMLLISTIAIVRFFKRKRNPNESSGFGKIVSAQKSATIVTDFLLAYILPMIAFDFAEIRDAILFVIYFALIAFLNIRNGNVYTNILFEFMGFRVYLCDIERNVAGKKHTYTGCTIISKENLIGMIGQEFSFFDFDNHIYINLN